MNLSVKKSYKYKKLNLLKLNFMFFSTSFNLLMITIKNFPILHFIIIEGGRI
jgi:hypothetical protein